MAELKCRKRTDLGECAERFDNRNSYRKAYRFGGDSLKNELKWYIQRILDRKYQSACTYLSTAKGPQQYMKAEEMFSSLSGFRDSDAKAKECIEEVDKMRKEMEKEEKRKENVYNLAMQKMQASNTKNAYLEAANLFHSIPGFRDSGEKAKECAEKAEKQGKELIYWRAVEQMKSASSEDSYESAIKTFHMIPGFRDSDELIQECSAKIKQLQDDSRRRLELRYKEKLIAAAERQRKTKKIILLTCGVLLVGVLWLLNSKTLTPTTLKVNELIDNNENTAYMDATVGPIQAATECKSKNIFDLDLYKQDPGADAKCKGTCKDAFGNEYSNGYICVDSYKSYDYSKTPVQSFVKYSAGSQYSTFSGTYFAGPRMREDARVKLQIYADSNLIFESDYLKRSDAPQKFSVSIRGAMIITIQAYSEDVSRPLDLDYSNSCVFVVNTSIK